MYKNKFRHSGNLLGDELLDNNGILIPKQEPELYGQHEKNVLQVDACEPIIKASPLEEKLGIHVQPDAEKIRLLPTKLVMPYEDALRNVRNNGYERFLFFPEVVEIARLAEYYGEAEALYKSLAFGGDEWLCIMMEKKGSDLIIYEEPEGMRLEFGYDPSMPISSINKIKMDYNCSKLTCSGSMVFKLGKDKMSGMEIPLSLFGPALIGYFIGSEMKDYPASMPEPVLCLPEENKRAVIGFSVTKTKVRINGNAIQRGYRGVRKLK